MSFFSHLRHRGFFNPYMGGGYYQMINEYPANQLSNQTAVTQQVQCRKCNTWIPLESNFCPCCGTNVAKKGRCSSCGQVNTPNAKFCNSCGVQV